MNKKSQELSIQTLIIFILAIIVLIILLLILTGIATPAITKIKTVLADLLDYDLSKIFK